LTITKIVVRITHTLLVASALLCAQEKQPGQAPVPEKVISPTPEKVISQTEAQELFRSVDELLQFASKSTGLPIKTPVKRELTSRDQLEAFLLKNMEEDEQQKRFERSELVIKKFGLLPRDFQLRAFLVKLLKEQVAGYYDSKDKTVHLMNWIEAEAQRPVLAHELMHALQDQDIDLEKWMKEPRDMAKKRTKSQADAEADEISAARQAVTEGQAMAVLLDYLVSPQGRTWTEVPEFVQAMQTSLDGPGQGGLSASTPLLIREALIWPYRDGLNFTYELYKTGGKDRAFRQALMSPPADTHQVLVPEKYLLRESVPPLDIPDLKIALGKAYETYDIGSIGQFDVEVIAKQFADRATAKRIGPGWRGGIYMAVTAKGTNPHKTGDLGIIFLSRWDTPERAADFALLYSGATAKRFTDAVQDKGYLWHTTEGDISAEVIGNTVLVMESFPADVSAKIRATVQNSMNQPAKQPANKVAVHYPELGPQLMPSLAAIQQLILPQVVNVARELIARRTAH
jgi:hypothetical protein